MTDDRRHRLPLNIDDFGDLHPSQPTDEQEDVLTELPHSAQGRVMQPRARPIQPAPRRPFVRRAMPNQGGHHFIGCVVASPASLLRTLAQHGRLPDDTDPLVRDDGSLSPCPASAEALLPNGAVTENAFANSTISHCEDLGNENKDDNVSSDGI